jgi:hypothetical protein
VYRFSSKVVTAKEIFTYKTGDNLPCNYDILVLSLLFWKKKKIKCCAEVLLYLVS